MVCLFIPSTTTVWGSYLVQYTGTTGRTIHVDLVPIGYILFHFINNHLYDTYEQRYIQCIITYVLLVAITIITIHQYLLQRCI